MLYLSYPNEAECEREREAGSHEEWERKAEESGKSKMLSGVKTESADSTLNTHAVFTY